MSNNVVIDMTAGATIEELAALAKMSLNYRVNKLIDECNSELGIHEMASAIRKALDKMNVTANS